MKAKFRKKSTKQKEKAAAEKLPRKSKSILRRKQERQEKKRTKKQKKNQFYQERFAKEAVQIREEGKGKKNKKQPAGQPGEVNQRTQTQLKQLEIQQREQRKKQLLLANELEARNIRQLEKQLGLARRKSSKLPKSFQEDGLDYVITACDSAQLAAVEEDSDAESKDDIETMMQSDQEEEEEGGGDSNEDEEEGDDDILGDGGSDDDYDDSGDEKEEVDQDDGDAEDESEGGEDTTAAAAGEEREEAAADTWEDIYGRTRAKDGRVLAGGAAESAPARYVPPALRKQAAGHQPDEKKRKELERLKKQVKGLLNRLAESNMHSIAAQLETFYRQHSRNDMNQTITDLITQAVVQDVLTPERLVMEHIMLVAILHANVGTEVGAHVVQEVVKLFNSNYSSTNLATEERKILDNVVLLLAYLYSFRIVGCQLVYDLLGRLADSFLAKDLELMLVMLRNAGFTLRKDDPVQMKGFITKVQGMASSRAGSPGLEDSRVKFMLEILLAVKNNNVNKIPNYDPSHFEHLKKTLKGYLREGNYVTELKLSWLDLEQAESRGRWWIVGSAFTGALAGTEPGAGATSSSSTGGEELQQQQYSQHLLKLARKLRMNTEARRNIFCLVLSSEDYLEAAERIVKLGTKNQLERDAIFVLTDCALQEKSFNPFYSQVAAKLATMDRKYKIAAQFTIWDKIRMTGDMKEAQLNNLARFIGHLIREKTQSIAVLRIVEFAEMTKPNVKLLRAVLCDILLQKDEQDVMQIFQAVSEPPKLSIFREGIKLFFHHFLLKQTSKLEPGLDIGLLQRRVQLAERALAVASSKLRL